jgi:hypothetical protein
MATFTLDIPDNIKDEVFTAVCTTQGYDPETDGTPAQFTRKVVVGFLKEMVVEHRVNVAASAKQATMNAEMAQLRSTTDAFFDTRIKIT